MTPDELVNLIFATQLEVNPDADPGDLTITVQDDMPMTVVNQDREYTGSFVERLSKGQGVVGDSVQDALEKYLKEVQDGNR